MTGFRVLICGGGIAAVEGLLRLRRLTGDALALTLLSPSEELRYRPMAVQEPFSRPAARRYPLREIARRAGADWVQASLEWVDPDRQEAHTGDGHSLPYDALLLAVGARTEVPYEHVTVFDDAQADDTYRGVVQDVEEGYTRSVALLVPEGQAMPRLVGPRVRGLPADEDGFVPVDERCCVRGLEPRVFAAGDAANLEVKHGGLGAQMADTAAAAIAALAGADVEVEPLRPVIHGVLYTGAEPLYLTARLEHGGVVESELSREPAWPKDEKVVADELAPFLRSLA